MSSDVFHDFFLQPTGSDDNAIISHVNLSLAHFMLFKVTNRLGWVVLYRTLTFSYASAVST
jgi:hypothetical protein